MQIFMQANESKPNQSNAVQSNHKPVVVIQTHWAASIREKELLIVYTYIYGSKWAARTPVGQSLEVGVAHGRPDVAAISQGKPNHKMPLTDACSRILQAQAQTQKKI